MAGRMINGAAALADLIRPASEADGFGAHRVLPVLPELSGLLPSRSLRRGTTIAIATGRSPGLDGFAHGTHRNPSRSSVGSTSLLLALISAASHAGSWCAVVGVPA